MGAAHEGEEVERRRRDAAALREDEDVQDALEEGMGVVQPVGAFAGRVVPAREVDDVGVGVPVEGRMGDGR